MFTGLKKSIDKKYSYPGGDLGNQIRYILYGFPKNLLQISITLTSASYARARQKQNESESHSTTLLGSYCLAICYEHND